MSLAQLVDSAGLVMSYATMNSSCSHELTPQGVQVITEHLADDVSFAGHYWATRRRSNMPAHCSVRQTSSSDLGCFKYPSCALSKCLQPTGAITGLN